MVQDVWVWNDNLCIACLSVTAQSSPVGISHQSLTVPGRHTVLPGGHQTVSLSLKRKITLVLPLNPHSHRLNLSSWSWKWSEKMSYRVRSSVFRAWLARERRHYKESLKHSSKEEKVLDGPSPLFFQTRQEYCPRVADAGSLTNWTAISSTSSSTKGMSSS